MTEGELRIDKCKQGINACEKFSKEERDKVLRICQEEPQELNIEIIKEKIELNKKCISCDDFRPK